MGQDLLYRADEEVYQYRFSRGDWDLVKSLRQYLPIEAELLFGVPDLGEEVRVRTDELSAAAERVDAFFTTNSQLLPYTYQFKCERPHHGGRDAFSTGGISGLRLPNDKDQVYSLWAGLNRCLLKKRGIGPDGHGFLVEERDLRSEREIQTENVGKITIRRTRAKSELRKAIREIRKYLQQIETDELIKIVG